MHLIWFSGQAQELWEPIVIYKTGYYVAVRPRGRRSIERERMTKNPRKISLIGSRATSILSVALVLVIIGLCVTLGVSVKRATGAVGDNTTILLTIVPGEDPLRVSEMKREFNGAPWVSRYEFADATTVLSRESSNMTDDTRAALELLSGNPFGDEFVLHLADGWRSTDSIDALTMRLSFMPGVDMVSSDSEVMGGANDGLRKVLIYLGILALVLLLISVALINTTISLSIYSRRFNINTMKLVGATNAFIRRPFVRAGMMAGVIAGVVAAAVVCGLQSYLMVNDDIVGVWITPELIVATGVGLIVAGALLARAAAWRAANVYLNRTYDELFGN